ncbi:hypothetical protein J6590_108692 [Homalodisca vitripennis]|nr:hypothetical protein J6590_108692 [Homalodisca vitripennis]
MAWKVIRSESCYIKPKNVIPISPDCLNSYFVNVSKNVHSDVDLDLNDNNHNDFIVNFDKPIPVSGFSWQPVSTEIVSQTISHLSNSKSEDVFGLSNYVVKTVGEFIVKPLTFLINLVLRHGIFPEGLKLTKITPIFKKGDLKAPECYRPIAIVPIIGKIIESCMILQLHEYFNGNNLLYSHQYGFRPKHNTVLAMEAIVEYIINGFENRHIVASNLIDLTKAFDCLSFNILYDKLYFYGIRKKELNLIKSYLSGRQQKVVVDDISSMYDDVIAGVPQGSVLGPFLYLIFVNDIYCNIPTFCVLYADDTTLLCSDSDFEIVKHNLSNAFTYAKRWFDSNNLVTNNSKTELIYFSLRDVPVTSNVSSEVKLLGFTLDNSLSWKPHILNLCKKLSRIVFLLRKLKLSIGQQTLLIVYYGLFHSQMNYGIRLWGNACHASKVFIWQKKAIRVLDCLTLRQSCKASFKKLKIITAPSLYILSTLLHVKQNIDSFAAQNFNHDHLTRNRNNLITPYVRLSKTLNSHVYQQLILYNKLPLPIRNLPFNKFKCFVSDWIKDQAFYTVAEYKDYNFSEIS